MEKISSIVPKSRRVSAVDMNSAPAVRPGAPSFGRPVGASTAGLKDQSTTAEKAVAEMGHMSDVRRLSAANADIVEQMANNFFLKKTVEAPAPIEIPELAPPVSASSAQSSQEAEEGSEDAAEYLERPAEVPNEYVPPGTFLNIKA